MIESRPHVIELQGVSKSFIQGEKRLVVLDRLDLAVKAGAFIAISAPSGSGKSTLLNLIGCLDKPDDGDVKIDGESVLDHSDNALADLRNRKIGFIFQMFHLVPVLNAWENVAYPLALRGEPLHSRRAKAEAMLAKVGLVDQGKKRPKQLSGGQRQRVAIARALVGEPAIVLADEPTANLDEKTALEIIALMRRLNMEQGATFLVSTHDPRIAEGADERLTLQGGQIAEIVNA